jgi:hypothetical protein
VTTTAELYLSNGDVDPDGQIVDAWRARLVDAVGSERPTFECASNFGLSDHLDCIAVELARLCGAPRSAADAAPRPAL